MPISLSFLTMVSSHWSLTKRHTASCPAAREMVEWRRRGSKKVNSSCRDGESDVALNFSYDLVRESISYYKIVISLDSYRPSNARLLPCGFQILRPSSCRQRVVERNEGMGRNVRMHSPHIIYYLTNGVCLGCLGVNSHAMDNTPLAITIITPSRIIPGARSTQNPTTEDLDPGNIGMELLRQHHFLLGRLMDEKTYEHSKTDPCTERLARSGQLSNASRTRRLTIKLTTGLYQIGNIQEFIQKYMDIQIKKATDSTNVCPQVLTRKHPLLLAEFPLTRVESSFPPGEHAPATTSTLASDSISESSNILILSSGTPANAELNRASVLFPPETLRIQTQETDDGYLRNLIERTVSNS